MGLFGKSKKEKEAEYMQRINVPACLEQDFRMEVEDVFLIVGVGTVVTGRISSGMCREGEAAVLEQTDGSLETVILRIDLHTRERKPNHAAYNTEHVGIALRGIAREQAHPGDVLIVKNGGQYRTR